MSYIDSIDQRMFDFRDYYNKVADDLPNDCIIAEVGVANGASALYLAQRLRSQGKTFKLYMIDSMAYGGVEQLTEIMRNVQRSGLSEFIEILPLDSLNASLKFNDNSLHHVFLDSGHTYQLTKQEIRCWYHKLTHGSTLAGHDYYSAENPGVKEAVDEMIPETVTRPAIINKEPIDGGDTKIVLDEFQPEQLLFTEDTSGGCGVWSVTKKFYWQPS